MSRSGDPRAVSAVGRHPRWVWVLGAVAILFGVATIVSGGSVLFGDSQTRAAAGAVVPFVLWFNFLAGFAYVAAGVGLALCKPWGAQLAALVAVSTLVASAFFAAHVLLGGAYEMRTAMAMTLRAAVWIAIALLGCSALGCTSAPWGAAIEKHPNGDKR
jgi:drug/metabolite transporter (DMT)-like permease